MTVVMGFIGIASELHRYDSSSNKESNQEKNADRLLDLGLAGSGFFWGANEKDTGVEMNCCVGG